MKSHFETVLQSALTLSEADRAEIAGALLQSLEPPGGAGIEEAWRTEVARRVADFEAGNVEAVPWEEVRDRLYSRLNAQRPG